MKFLKKWWFYVILLLILVLILVLFFSPKRVDEVEVPNEMRTCSVDSDCTYVETLCSSCCGFVGINKNYVDEFRQKFRLECGDYFGPVCDCIGPSEPKCVNSVCVTDFQ